MSYQVKHEPTDQNVARLIEAAAEVEPEWVTVIRLAWESGIKTSIARHLGPPNLNGAEIAFQPYSSKGVMRRILSDKLVAYLRNLTGATSYFCPNLHALSSEQFGNQWRKVCVKAGLEIHLITLIWPYRRENDDKIRWEHSRRHLESLAREFLEDTEMHKLRADAENWARLGAKKGNRRGLLTRDQILAPFK
jgi:hypothetical protein